MANPQASSCLDKCLWSIGLVEKNGKLLPDNRKLLSRIRSNNKETKQDGKRPAATVGDEIGDRSTEVDVNEIRGLMELSFFKQLSTNFRFACLTLKVASPAFTWKAFDLFCQNHDQPPSSLLASQRACLQIANRGAAALQLTSQRAARGPAREAYACWKVESKTLPRPSTLLDRFRVVTFMFPYLDRLCSFHPKCQRLDTSLLMSRSTCIQRNTTKSLEIHRCCRLPVSVQWFHTLVSPVWGNAQLRQKAKSKKNEKN